MKGLEGQWGCDMGAGAAGGSPDAPPSCPKPTFPHLFVATDCVQQSRTPQAVLCCTQSVATSMFSVRLACSVRFCICLMTGASLTAAVLAGCMGPCMGLILWCCRSVSWSKTDGAHHLCLIMKLIYGTHIPEHQWGPIGRACYGVAACDGHTACSFRGEGMVSEVSYIAADTAHHAPVWY